ncbi:DUF3298 domain-containing protein [Hymenobacter gummosus]|uniref:DUF3298 domain-containing protein n=1 Tax=Hymenobacter gummosus TaxID=1776032 RepID=A0A431U8H8_9BACT|nr:RsiV family protein [Hymenobacter gummosus]RTQ52557.1 DUF3298 domain-containing protein [Hymenobacter gummosus]
MLIMRCWPLAGCLLLAAACESRRPTTETATPPAQAGKTTIAADSGATAADSAAGAPKPAAPDSAAAPAAPVVQAWRRYVGTVGTAPVVLELETVGSAPVQGHYFYHRGRGGRLMLHSNRTRPGQPLTLQESDQDRATGRWQTRQPLGPVLSGTWYSPDGRRQLPFRLREDYTDGVRYTINTYSRQFESADCAPGEEQVSEAQWDELRLRPPVSAALGRVKRHFDQLEHMAEPCIDSKETVEVTYNADFLLSVEQFHHEFAAGTPHPTGYYSYATFDLRTGRALPLAELLRPDFELPLRRLLSARLRTDPGYADFYQGEIEGDSTQTRWPLGPDGQPLVSLPHSGYYLTPAGVGFQYNMYEIGPYVMGPQLVELSYRDIRPLVRPGSALARLLQRRGL